MNEIKLGNCVKDIITGFEGTATAKVEYINGCIQFCITPKIKDGVMLTAEYVDSQQLKKIADGVEVVAEATGGVARNAPSTTYKG